MRLQRAVAGPVVLREERHLPVLLDAGALGRAHRALSLEDDPFVDHEARCRDVAVDLPGRTDLEPLPGRDVARDLPVHDDRAAVDLCIDDGALADRQGVLRRDLALDVSFDANRAFEGELAGDAAPLAENRARRSRLVRFGLLPLTFEHLHHPWRSMRQRLRRRRSNSPRPVAPLTILAE